MYTAMILGALAAASGLSGAVDEAVRGVALKPDPPFAIDGDLGDWANVPNAYAVKDKAQAVWGAGAWTSADDLSGVVRLAWRYDNLYVAADVVDDQLRQTQRGDGIWKGDHVELYLDVQPDLEPKRDRFGAGQFHWAFSPGNFLKTGDALADCPPDAFCFRPRGVELDGVKVGAKRTERGWTVEAAVPWRLLGVERPAKGMTLRFEIAISDTDSPEPKQESMMTTLTGRWAHNRSRLALAALAGSDGKPPAIVRQLPIFKKLELARGGKQTFTFEAPPVPEGRDGVLVLNARLHTPKPAGHTPALHLALNGKPISGRRFVNKPLRAESRGGKVYSMAAGDRLTTYYCPTFRSPDLHPTYGLLNGIKACDFELRVTDLLKEGANELVVSNQAHPKVKRTLIAADARIEFRVPPPPERQRRPAPTGPLAVIEPRRKPATDYSLTVKGNGELRVEIGGQKLTVLSRFSTPKPAWVTGPNRYFDHKREAFKRAEAIVVRDTFTNRTSENLAVMQRHEVKLGDALKRVWLAGLRRPGRVGSSSEPANPTTFGVTDSVGVGLLPLSDVMRLHLTNYAPGGGVIGIADNHLAIPPGGAYTAEWAVVPTAKPDYWRFLNTARHLMDVNFTIDGGFCFFRASPKLTEPWSDEQTRKFILNKDVRYCCASITAVKGRYTHGTAFQVLDDHSRFIRAFERRRRLVPGIQNLVYFHCFLDVLDESPARYADARILRPDGSQADYGKPHQRLFFPTETNSYGPAVAKNVDVILDKIKAEGVYWDEHERSAYSYHYGQPWDGVSCDVDPKRMTVTRLKSSVTLLTEKWRVALGKRIQARGPLIGNGPVVTRAFMALKFPCFVETGSITNCTRAHLWSPVALGDHLTERSEQDAYGTMLAALDYGCVYHWYNDLTVIPTHHHLTRYMFPITPMELHKGYIIGAERIVTNTSGLFGWGDASEHEAHVFDHTGREVADAKAPLVRRNGKTYTELRLAEGWSAAVVRKR